jgi:hypothetical protein
MKGQVVFFSTCALALALAGCGGGGGSTSTSSGDGGGGGEVVDYGTFSIRSLDPLKQPVIIGSKGAVMTSVFGGTMTDIRLKLPDPGNFGSAGLSSTVISFQRGLQPMLMDFGSRQTWTATSDIGSGTPRVSSVSSLGEVAMVGENSGSGRDIYVQNLDGTNRRKVTSLATSAAINGMCFSPDGKKLAFSADDTVAGRFRIHVVTVASGATTKISDTIYHSYWPTWTFDNKITYVRDNFGAWSIVTSDANGGNLEVNYGPISNPLTHPTWSVDKQELWWGSFSSPNYALNRRTKDGGQGSSNSNGTPLSGMSMSPDGQYLVFAKGAGLTLKSLATLADVPLTSDPMDFAPSWSPYMTTRTIVGPGGGIFGTAAGGFILSQLGREVRALVGFNAVTASSIDVDPQSNPNPNQENAVCIVSADELNSLKFLNELQGGVVTIITSSASTHVRKAQLSRSRLRADML